MSIDVGERLRFVRARNKISQRELAKRSGVTNSTISLIESNQMNPSVGALKRILDGLPMGLAEFHPLTGERRIPAGHPVLKSEATFEQTLEIDPPNDGGQASLALGRRKAARRIGSNGTRP